MSKLIANWELAQKNRNDQIQSLIELLNESRAVFLTTPDLALAVNRFAVRKMKTFDFTCDDFLLYLLAHNEHIAAKYWDLKDFFEHFFETTLPKLFSHYNSLQIGQSDYINIVSTDQVAMLYLEKAPLTNVFLISNLKMEPFAYSDPQITMVKRLITFLNAKNNNGQNLVGNFFSFSFLSLANKQKALFIREGFLQKLNDMLKLAPLQISSVNYNVLIESILSKPKA